MVMIHNCGGKICFDRQIERIHPEAISFLYPPDDCKNFKECKEKYGDKTMLIGSVDPTHAVFGSDEDWIAECKKSIDDMAACGGFVLATGCEYPLDADFKRVHLMQELAKTYGSYEK